MLNLSKTKTLDDITKVVSKKKKKSMQWPPTKKEDDKMQVHKVNLTMASPAF